MPILKARLLHSPTANWDQTRAFYRDLLALPETGGWDEPNDRGAFLQPPAAEIELMEQDAATLGLPTSGWSLLLEVDDLEAELTRLASHGIKAERGIQLRPWGVKDALIRDPAGTALILFQQVPQQAD